MSIQLRRNVFPNDYSVLLLSDDSWNAHTIINNIKDEQLFEEAYVVNKKKYSTTKARSIQRKVRFLYSSIFGSKHFSNVEKKEIDRLFYYNDDYYLLWLFASITKHNTNIELNRIEEGPISYCVDPISPEESKLLKCTNVFRKILKKPIFKQDGISFYCFNPELYYGSLEPRSVPKISSKDKSLSEILCRIFDINNEDVQYDKKFVFFTSMIDKEKGVPGGELFILSLISKVIGKENVIVKKHPRDEADEYSSFGYKVDSYSRVPFEIIQLLFNFKDYVFITTLSGSVLSINSIIEKPPNIMFVYKLYPQKENDFINKWGPQYEIIINKLMDNNKNLKVDIIESKGDLRNKLIQYK